MSTASARPRRPSLGDVWPALPFLAVGLIGTQAAGIYQPSARVPDVLAYLLIGLAAGALAARHWPAHALAANGAAVTAYLAMGYPFGPILLTVPAVVCLVSIRWPVRRALLAAAAYCGVLIVAFFVKNTRGGSIIGPVEQLVITMVWALVLATALVLGAAIRVRRAARADVLVEQARRAVADERLRMAQDLHDSIGHGLAVIAMQAGVALHVLERSPGEARAPMEAVRATSRESLENLRFALEALRSPGTAELRPAPGLADLPRLIDRLLAGGVQITLAGAAGELRQPVDAAAYRIVQEALTNVLRHALGATAHISLTRTADALLVEVTDSGGAGGGVPAGAGSGIRGMHAQAEALGGTLSAGPRAGGGFAVAARLPLDGEGA
ncbi:sensor histidine kinase [Crossiella cryophila]|uniref:histidine kinase n=1 Tax=Crossiella cryophila TaxID=43355 RepID=A0A7W7C6F0_9PSEU|nr:histidine kinase [Crossiella cryophila]MBB4674028.1 signal transduction histidine kinase [Crossiella cryophila]